MRLDEGVIGINVERWEMCDPKGYSRLIVRQTVRQCDKTEHTRQCEILVTECSKEIVASHRFKILAHFVTEQIYLYICSVTFGCT
ncbi:MAG: hypothetical protein C0183_09230 [Roseiflexus castenholzii]|nr:MAG: hypothetical protein C0183_09230 [Roseiflexus castenholzii]